MKPLIFLLLLVSSLCLVSPVMADEMLSLKAGYQVLKPEGQFAGTTNGIGTEVDIQDDLNFSDSEDITLEAALQLGNFRLSAGYLPLKTDGFGTGLNFSFNGENFVGDVASSIDAKIYDLGLTYYLINMNDIPSRFQLGLEAAVKIVDAEISVTGATVSPFAVNVTEKVSGTVPIPTLGGRLRVALGDFIGVVGRAGYMTYSGNSILDAEAQVEFSPLPLVGIYGGYRYFDLKVDENDAFLDATFQGPFVGALVRF